MTPPLSLTCVPLRADAALAFGGTYPTFILFLPRGAAETPRRGARPASVSGRGGGAPHSSRTGPASRSGGVQRRVGTRLGSRAGRRGRGFTPAGNSAGET